MRINPGTYQASEDLILTRKQSHGNGQPRTIEYRTVRAGESFKVPFTTNRFYYTTKPLAQVKEEVAAILGL